MENLELLWWHWAVFGAFLLIVDIALINVYFLVWFGFGAVFVSLLKLAAPAMLVWQQLMLFSLFSALLLALWLVVLRPRFSKKHMRKAQLELPGQAGVVVRFADGHGLLRLQRPIGGSDIWAFAVPASVGGSPRPGDRLIIRSVDEEGVVQVSAEALPNAPLPNETVRV